MARYKLIIWGNNLQQRTVDKLAKSLEELKDGVSVTVVKDDLPTSRQARLDAALSQVEDAASEVGSLRDELQEWYDNLPENLQSGEKADQLQLTVDELDSLVDGLGNIDGSSIEFPGMF